MKDIMASASGTGLSPSVEPVPVSPPDGASIPDAVPAWSVEVYWLSMIVREIGWFRPKDRKEERTFKTRGAAQRYAASKTGIPSILVPFMRRKGVVVGASRSPDFWDRLRAKINQAPKWKTDRGE